MDENQTPKSGKKGVFITIIVLVIAAIGGFFDFFKGNKSTEMNTNQPPSDTTNTPVSEVPGTSGGTGTQTSTEYKDGTYKALGDYVSPGGSEEISVTVTLKNDLITDASVESKAFRPQSVAHQNMFISGFKQYVIGKSLDQVVLDKVSGSSLTPKGWNDAIEKIKVEAKA